MPGRLIFPVVAEIFCFAGAAAEDPDFREPVLASRPELADERGVELPPVRLPCQVEPEVEEALRMMPAGEVPCQRLDLVFHTKDLGRAGLVHRGTLGLKPRDRLAALYDKRGRLLYRVPTPPGLFAVNVRPAGLGFQGSRLNLVRVTFTERAQAAPRFA
jgi:hypothetical protein